MRRPRLWTSTAALAGLFSVSIVRAQDCRPPASLPTPLVPPPRHRRHRRSADRCDRRASTSVDARHESRPGAGSGSASKVSRVDSDPFPWALKFNGWDGGVVPIEFGADVTAAQRDQFMTRLRQHVGTGRGGDVHPTHEPERLPPDRRHGYRSRLRMLQCHRPVPAARGLRAPPGRRVLGRLRRSRTSSATRSASFTSTSGRTAIDTSRSISSNVPSDKHSNFTRITSLIDPEGPYDFLSIMHYAQNAFATDRSKPTIDPQRRLHVFCGHDGDVGERRPISTTPPSTTCTTAICGRCRSRRRSNRRDTQFDRNDFLDAMERLHAFYYSRMGLNRPAGALHQQQARLPRRGHLDLRHLPGRAVARLFRRAGVRHGRRRHHAEHRVAQQASRAGAADAALIHARHQLRPRASSSTRSTGWTPSIEQRRPETAGGTFHFRRTRFPGHRELAVRRLSQRAAARLVVHRGMDARRERDSRPQTSGGGKH